MNSYDLLVAESLRVARSVAEIDCGWRAIGQGMWGTPDGRLVRYAATRHSLRGCRDSILYLGHRWYANHELDPHTLEAFAEACGLTINYPEASK
jgi:hypothetical protein